MKLLTAAQMREADRRTIAELGLPGPVLMECAGRSVVEQLSRRFPDLCPGPAVILCGKGNNGGDGFVIARHLQERGWQVATVVLCEATALGGDARLQHDILQRYGAALSYAPDAPSLATVLKGLPSPRLIVDALLGTGLSLPVGGHYAEAIAWINAARVPVVAVDIPSGLDATSGQILGAAVRADLTVTFAAAKLGQVLHPGCLCCGDLMVSDIGIPQNILADNSSAILLEAEEVRPLLPLRPEAGHKGTFGHLLLVAGSAGKAGAAALSAQAALRSGAGLVTVAAPATTQQTLAVKLTEAMTLPLAESNGGLASTSLSALMEAAQDKSVLALGPGLGQTPETTAVIRRIVRDSPLPLMLDADALNALAGDTEILLARPCGTTILTPHPGEMARLTGSPVAVVEADRVAAARSFAEQHGVILVLKGAKTVIAAPDGGIFINPTGHAGMASGGMGDILTGIIAGLLTQGAPPVAAACAGVWLHGHTADRLLDRYGDAGLLASDLLAELPATRWHLLHSGGAHAEGC